MDTVNLTRPSLLVRIRDMRDEMAWGEFARLYTPLIYRYARQTGLQDADASLVTQDVLVTVARTIHRFEYNRSSGSFRGWLKVVTRSRLSDFLRAQRHQVQGSGGMGIVLRGIDSRLNRVVAIKVLAPELASNPNARRRFYREGQAAAAVSHDHVVTIHAVDDHERLPYLVMEFVAGESLEECVRRTGPLPVESILRMGRQTALGLAAAHEVGLVHRDMKPANILLENGIQRVRITDFGLARAIDDVSITQSGTVSGTPLYMSPEQASGDSVDHRSDLFSLGSVLYTMCTGRPAFRAQATLAVLKRVCEDTPRPIREVNPEIPEWLAEIIDRLMAKQPNDRIQSAAAVAELLGGHLAHLQDPNNVPAPVPAAVTVTEVESNGPPKVRSKRLLLLVALLLGASTLGVTEAAGVTKLGEFLGIVLKLKTSEGTLVVGIEVATVKVSVDGDDVVIDGISIHELRLKPGKHQWTAKREGMPAEAQWVTIERGGKTVVRVKRISPATVSSKGDDPFASLNPSIAERRAEAQLKHATDEFYRFITKHERYAETKFVDLLAKFNQLVNARRFAEAAVISKRAQEFFPDDQVVQQMLQKIYLASAVADKSRQLHDPFNPPSPLPDPNSSNRPDNAARTAGLTSSGTIRLSTEQVAMHVGQPVSKPGVFGVGAVQVRPENLPVFYSARVLGNHSDGHTQLVGQITGGLRPGDRFAVERIERTGNQLRIVFRHYTTDPVFSAVTNRQGIYVDADAKQQLIASIREDVDLIKQRLDARKRHVESPDSDDLRTPNVGIPMLGRVKDTVAGASIPEGHRSGED